MISAHHTPECADIVTSTDDYARRFSGEVGRWMIDRQSLLTQEMLAAEKYQSALDVGGGHGQLLAPLSTLGMNVTILGSDPSCERQIESATRSKRCSFVVGNLTKIPFADRSFDLVTSIRFVSHCETWPQLIAEMCRVADRGVFIDYPPLLSSNILAPVTFRIKKFIEGNTRPFSIFLHRDIEREFNRNGYVLASRQGQFMFPMAIHRLVKSRRFSDTIEKIGWIVWLNARFGSPTLAHFIRKS